MTSKSHTVESAHGSTGTLSDADADKILLKLTPAKPRKTRKYKAELTAAEEWEKSLSRRLVEAQEAATAARRDTDYIAGQANASDAAKRVALTALANMERRAARYLKWALWGWLFAAALVIARMVGK
jgi:hypothetical protein